MAAALRRRGAWPAAVAFLLLRPLIGCCARPPAGRERMVTHAATFRALADTRVWFFRRLAERLPAGIGLRRSGDLLGRLVADVEALDGLYLRVMVPGRRGAGHGGGGRGAAGRARRCWRPPSPCRWRVALLLPLLLAPGAARAAAEAAEAQGRLRAAAVDPLLGIEDTLAANGEAAGRRRAGARRRERWPQAQRRLAGRAALAGAAGTLLTQAALLGALAWGLAAGGGRGGAGGARRCSWRWPRRRALGLLPRAGAALAAAAAGARRLFEAADAAAAGGRAGRARAALPTGHAIRIEGLRFRLGAGPRAGLRRARPRPAGGQRGSRCSARRASASPPSPRCC